MIHFIALIALMGSFLNWTEYSYWEWAILGDGSHREIKAFVGLGYILAAAYYVWVFTRVEVFADYRKLPHTLIKSVLGVLWIGALLLMHAELLPGTFEVFYTLVVLSLAIAGAIICAMHAEAKQGPNAEKIKAKIASARQPAGTVR